MNAQARGIQTISPVQPRRFGLNLIGNVGNLGLTMMVGVFYVPFLVRHLGAAAYGLVPLISMVTAYMNLITMALDCAISRSMTMALERKDNENANLIFNVSIWGNFALTAVALVPAVLAIVYVDHILRIPAGFESATRWLFVGTVAAFLLNQIRTPFSVSTFCRNRLDLYNVVAASETLTRVGLVVGLFYLMTPKIEYVGLATFAGTMVSAVGTIWLWKALTPELRVQLGQFDWKLLKELCGTGGWVVVSQLGLMLYLNIDLLLANRCFGPEQGGRYAAVLLVPTLLRSGAIAVGGIFPPTMFKLYAREATDELVSYLNGAIKFLGMIMALGIGFVCGFAEPLLRLWLGPTFSDLAPLLFIMAIHLCLSLSMYPLYAVPLAANRMRTQGLVAVGVGVGNLFLALFLAQVCGWGLYGLAVAGAILLTIRYFLFAPLYAARILHRPYQTFYRAVPSIVLATLATIGMCKAILWYSPISNWIELGMAAAAVSLVFSSLVYLLLSPQERIALKNTVARFRKAA